MTQPPNSGAPTPVQGVTGGPAVLGGQIGNDPSSGNVVINPNPGNAVEIKKSPSAFNVFEYFNSNTDNSRLTLATALGGPDIIGIISAPTSVIRNLQITASGSGIIQLMSPTSTTFPLTVDAGVTGTAYIAIPHTGASFGPVAATADIRLVNNALICWRNGTNTGDVQFGVDSSNRVLFGNVAVGGPPGTTFSGAITMVVNGVARQVPFV